MHLLTRNFATLKFLFSVCPKSNKSNIVEYRRILFRFSGNNGNSQRERFRAKEGPIATLCVTLLGCLATVDQLAKLYLQTHLESCVKDVIFAWKERTPYEVRAYLCPFWTNGVAGLGRKPKTMYNNWFFECEGLLNVLSASVKDTERMQNLVRSIWLLIEETGFSTFARKHPIRAT